MKSNTARLLNNQLRTKVIPMALRAGYPLVWLRRRLKPHKIHLCKVESAVEDGQSLSIRCGLSAQAKLYFLNLAFGGPTRESDPGMARLMDVFWPGREKDCPMTVIETNRGHFDWLKKDGWFFIPLWVRGAVSLPIPEQFLRHNSVKNDLRKIRQHQYGYVITHDEEKFKDFYHNMHLPHIRAVFGDTACFDSYEEKRQKCERYDLLMIHKKDRPEYDIAGVLIIYDLVGPRMWSLGVRHDGVDRVKEGALAALYHFSFEHAAAGGNKRLSLGASRAFLNDGALNFKKKLSNTITDTSWEGFALKISKLTPAVKAFLVKNPFIFQRGNEFFAAVFVDEPLSLEGIRKIEKTYFYPGLSRLVIHTFSPDETFQATSLPPEMVGRIKIRPAAEIVG